MIPEVSSTCLFTFIPKFALLDGVYKVRSLLSFQDAIASGVDFDGNLYSPAGLSAQDFRTDYASYAKDIVSVLESVHDADRVFYAPQSTFLNVPDPTVRAFYPLIAVVDLGVQKNPQFLLPLLDKIKDLIRSHLGTSEPVRCVTNPNDKVYLTDSDYAVLEQTRKANIQSQLPLSVQIKTLEAANRNLTARCAAYEATIIASSKQTP